MQSDEFWEIIAFFLWLQVCTLVTFVLTTDLGIVWQGELVYLGGAS